MTKLVLVGCGNMGFAMLKGWLSSAPAPDVHVVEPNEALRVRAAEAGANAVGDPEELAAELAPDLIVLAVKPQVMRDVVPSYVRFAGGPAVFVSIAAGTTIATLGEMLPGPTPIIRCMPNTPAAIGHGMLVCCANDHVPHDKRSLTDALLAHSGMVDWIDNEELMDAVTALSGSGPAYVFHLIECLADAGAGVGLPPELAGRMAMQTVMGAGRLAAQSGVEPGILRSQVTSPGGTTAAALGVMMKDERLAELMREAVVAARDRGKELSAG